MKTKSSFLALAAASLGVATGQTSYTTSGTTAWNTARWNNSTDAAPYTSAYTANQNVNFTSGNYSFAGMGTTVNVGNVNVSSGANVTYTAASGAFATGGNVRTLTVASGSVLDFSTQGISTAAGTGFIKEGGGVLALSGAAFTGGFTLNAGTVVARNVSALGGAGNTATLNGGALASVNANTTFAAGNIVIGGNVQFGEITANLPLAVNNSANLTFNSLVSLGAANRVLTLGNAGVTTFGGVISNTGTAGVTFAANAAGTGRFDVTNAANTFTGNISVTGGEVRFTSDGSLGAAANTVVIDGGRFATVNNGTFALGASRNLFVGDTAGTAISTTGSGTFTINSVIADVSGKTGAWAKQGAGTLELGGASTYTGATAIHQGTLRLTTGNDRLPAGTVVSLGQAATANLGTLDLNGNSQTIAGLNSTSGTNASGNTNLVTSSTASTLTINASTSTTHVYSTGTAANSGVLTGALSLVKEGAGTQVLGGANTYTGTTTVDTGILLIQGSHTGGSGYTIGSNGAIGGNGTINGSLSFVSGAGFVFNPLSPLTVNGGTVTFGNFSISDLIGLDGSTAENTYTLINGTAAIDFTNVANFGSDFAVSIGGGKSAYFESGSLNLVVIPEPSAAALLGGLGLLGLLRRRRG